jgi:hypothetical protein
MPSYGDRFDLLLHGLSLEMIQVAPPFGERLI